MKTNNKIYKLLKSKLNQNKLVNKLNIDSKKLSRLIRAHNQIYFSEDKEMQKSYNNAIEDGKEESFLQFHTNLTNTNSEYIVTSDKKVFEIKLNENTGFLFTKNHYENLIFNVLSREDYDNTIERVNKNLIKMYSDKIKALEFAESFSS